MRGSIVTAAVLALSGPACSDSAGAKNGADAGPIADEFETGLPLRVPVADEGRTFVKLSPLGVVVPDGDPATSPDWDLAFDGFDVFTNGGVSGAGQGAAFGPLDPGVFATGDTSNVPFLTQDKAGGAFLDWYAYEGETHALFSRYHVYGVQEGARSWKVQVLTYYGQRDGAAVPALYAIRYAEIAPGRIDATREASELDGSAGGVAAPPTAPSECIDLGTGARTMLIPEVARNSSEWHLCFRRSSILVNGETGGPRGVGAVDLAVGRAEGETLATIQAKSPESERPAFDEATAASFEGRTFRGDRAVSAFGDLWADRASVPNTPVHAAWLVRDALGRQKYLVGFTSFENPTPKSPGTVVVRIKPARGG